MWHILGFETILRTLRKGDGGHLILLINYIKKGVLIDTYCTYKYQRTWQRVFIDLSSMVIETCPIRQFKIFIYFFCIIRGSFKK